MARRQTVTAPLAPQVVSIDGARPPDYNLVHAASVQKSLTR